MLALTTGASTLPAQQWQAEAGAAAVRFDSSKTIGSGTLSGGLEWLRRGVAGAFGASVAVLDSGQWTGQLYGGFTGVFGRARDAAGLGAALSLGAAGSRHSSGFNSGSSRLEIRLQHSRPGHGWWAGVSGTTGGNSTFGNASAWGPTLGGWALRGRWVLAGAFFPSRVGGAWYPEVGLRASVVGRGWEMGAYAGHRWPPAATGVRSTTSIGASAAYWVVPSVAVTAAAGTSQPDLLQSLPRSLYVSVGIRLSGGRRPLEALGSAREMVVLATATEQLKFRVPGAQTVEVVGDWTGWERVALTRSGRDEWVLAARLEPGEHRFNLVVDGSRWIVPDGYPWVDDGFGGRTGILVVGE